MGGKRIWPAGDADFNLWYKNVMQIVSIKSNGANPEWTHIPQDAVASIENQYQEWYTAYAACLVPHIPSVTTAKNDARAVSEKFIRRFKKLYLDSDFVTNAERVDMRLPLRDTVSSVVLAATVAPEGDLFFPGVGLVRVANIRPIADAGALYDKRSLHGVKIAYGLMGKTRDKFPLQEVPLTGDDLPHSKFTRRKYRNFDFQGESGNTVYFCLCYENSKGEAGPWGLMLKAVIP